MNNNNIGALWNKKAKDGRPFMTGKIMIGTAVDREEGTQKEINIVCFLNDRKTKDNQPDWHILIARPREDKTSGTSSSAKTPQETRPSALQGQPEEEIRPESIPF